MAEDLVVLVGRMVAGWIDAGLCAEDVTREGEVVLRGVELRGMGPFSALGLDVDDGVRPEGVFLTRELLEGLQEVAGAHPRVV